MEKTEKTKTKSHFMQVNPHLILLDREIHKLNDLLYDSKKNSLVLKGQMQSTLNSITDKSNELVVDIFNLIQEIRNNHLNDDKDFNKMVAGFDGQIKKVIDLKNQNRTETKLLEMRVDKCEKDVGYHLLGDKFNEKEHKGFYTEANVQNVPNIE